MVRSEPVRIEIKVDKVRATQLRGEGAQGIKRGLLQQKFQVRLELK